MNDKQKLIQEIEGWKQQFAQAEMIIDDIKKITECESDDGVEIVESVENLRQKARKEFKQIVDEVKQMIKQKRIVELGCSKCYNPNHLKVPYNCGCDCHKFALLDIVNQKFKEVDK